MNNSPCIRAELKSLIERFSPSGAVFTYAERADCECLWAQLAKPTGQLPWSTVVILYDGQCDRSGMDFQPERWLTPWDWAVALSVSLKENRSRIPDTGFCCMIVDLLPSNWGSEGRSRFKTVGALTPWIRWYRPLSSAKPLAGDFGALIADLKHSSNTWRMQRASLPALDLHTLSRTWAALFGAPSHRHDIGNLIGPQVLAKGLLEARGLSIPVGEDWVTQRFFSLVKVVGLDVGQDGNDCAPIPDAAELDIPDSCKTAPPSTTGPEFKRPLARSLQRLARLWGEVDGSLRIALVDDQYTLGYHKTLAHLFFDSAYSERGVGGWLEARATPEPGDICVRVRSTSRPDVLRELLGEALAGQRHLHEPRIFGRGEIDILLLDLRLFAGSTPDNHGTNDSPGGREKVFLGQLLDLCRQWKLLGETDPQLVRAIHAAERRVKDGHEELLSLTLLPLLIHAVDPSLPIVLFSSTHQREVVDSFGNHPSIITSFAKPVMSGYTSVRLDLQAAADLESALRRALRLHRMRTVWRGIHKLLDAVVAGGGPLAPQELIVRETSLTPRGVGKGEYRIDLGFIRILATEYRALFLTGRFSDALQVPDNLMEFTGAKFMSPFQADDAEILLRLHSLLPPSGRWSVAINQALANSSLRDATIAALGGCVRYLAGNLEPQQKASFDGLHKLARAIPSLCAGASIAFIDFENAEPEATKIIKRVHKSIGAALVQAIELRLEAADKKFSGLAAGMDLLARYQFHAILAAMRNGRSHFRCRPLEHDRGLELSATWLWRFFLVGVRLLARGESPISVGPNVEIDAIKEAVLGQWLPSSSLDIAEEGDAYCRIILLRFGHLIRLCLLQCHPELNTEANQALRLASRDIARTVLDAKNNVH